MMEPMKRVALRRRLILLAAAGILPLAIMSGIALFAGYQQQRRQAEMAGLDVTRALATAVDAELRRTIAVLEVLATSLSFDTGDIAGFSHLAQRALRSYPHWRVMVVADPGGAVLFNSSYPMGTQPSSIIERESFEKLVRTRAPVVGSLAKGPRGELAIPIRVPVQRDGRLLYVLTAVVTPEVMLQLINRQRVPQSWVVSIFDAHGMRVARSRAHEENLGTPATPSLRELMAARGQEGTGLTKVLEGQDAYTAFTKLPNMGWSVAIGISPSELEAGARRSFLVYGGGILLSTILGLFAALMVARSIAEPMGQLRRAAQAMGRNDPPVAPVTEIHEIREVADALVAASEQRQRAEAEREALLRSEQSARAAAEAANRSKDEFLAMLGHELRNPLGAISNAAGLLEHEGTTDAMRHQATQIIGRQVSHLTRLTDDLLDAGRALMGKIVLQRRAVDLAAAASQSLRTLVAAGRTQKHAVIEDVEAAWVEADPIRLDQIISNLVINAVKYTPSGGTIRVTVRREGEDAVLRVRDDGIGLTPELASRVFDLFVQGDRDLDRALGGLGIGLTLVRRLAEMHGGWASVKSDGPGQGSEFTVRLPAIQKPAQVEAASKPAPAASGRDILVIEDNDDARETLCTLLGLSGHRVESAADGVAGLEKALAGSHDIMLVDVGLPRIDGYEVARRVRAAGGAHRPFLVAVTGYGAPEDRERAREAGFDAHLVKPVDLDELNRVLALATPSGGPSESARP